MPVGEKVAEEIIFSVRMLMIKYNLTPADMLRVLVTIDKERG